MDNLTITEDKEVFKIYRIKSENNKTYYGITTQKLNMCVNLLKSYTIHKPDNKKEYYDLLDTNSVASIIEKFNNRPDAKKRLHELIKSDSECVNIIKEPKEKIIKDKEEIIIKPKAIIKQPKPKKEKIIKEPKIKVKKTDNPEYAKKYYEDNKDKLKQYYENHKQKISEYNRQKYQQIKEKLNKLKELEDKNN